MLSKSSISVLVIFWMIISSQLMAINSEDLIKKFKTVCDTQDNDELDEHLKEIVTSAEGRELLKRIVDIYYNQGHNNIYANNQLIENVVSKKNKIFFSGSDLQRKLTMEEARYVAIRNHNLQRKVRFVPGDNAKYNIDIHTIVFRPKTSD